MNKAATIIKLVGMVSSLAIALLADNSATALVSAALIAVAIAVTLFFSARNALSARNVLLIFAVDLIISCLAYAWGGNHIDAYLYIVPLSLMGVAASCQSTATIATLSLFLVSTFTLQYISLQGEFVKEPLYNFLQASHWLSLAGAGLAFVLSGLALKEKLSPHTGLQHNLDLQLSRISALMLVIWCAVMLFANDLAGHIKYKGELVTETNFHQTCLVIAVLLLLLLGRVKRAFTFVLLSAIIAFFLTVAATYVMVNGFQVIYFLALARVSLLKDGNNLKSKISMALLLIAFILSTQINPASVFPDAITGSAQLFMLDSFTYPQITGMLFAILALAIIGLRNTSDKAPASSEATP